MPLALKLDGPKGIPDRALSSDFRPQLATPKIKERIIMQFAGPIDSPSSSLFTDSVLARNKTKFAV